MADIELHRVHDLGLAAAREQADRMAGQIARKFDLKSSWQGNVLRFERPGVDGALTLTDKDLRLSVTLGFLLKAMRASIERAVEEQLDELFARPQAAAPRAKPAASPKPTAGRKAPPPRKKGG